MRHIICFLLLLAIMARAVPAAAWGGATIESSTGHLPAGSDDLPEEDPVDTDTEKEMELEKEAFTRPAQLFHSSRIQFPRLCQPVYHPSADAWRSMHFPDVHTPPPDFLY